MTSDTKKRVKLYILNEQRQWDDKGTGHVTSVYNDKLRCVTLIVKSEIDGSTLLESRILPHTAYQKQQDTLIVWSEGERRDLALSFQEKAGCDEIWEKICEVQGKDPSLTITRETLDESDDEQIDAIDNSPLTDLPPCELSKLKEIKELFNELPRKSSSYKEKFTSIIETDGYIKKLIDLFHICEDLENIDGLHYLYEIFRNIFYLNRSSLFDILLSEDYIMDVIGCLEYDPNKTEPNRHREFINTRAQFKEVIPFNNSELVAKIHQTYRIQYIQDVILPAPSVFEENALGSLSSFVFLNKAEISNMIQEDNRYLKELFENLKNPNLDDKKRRDMFQFLKEFITFSHGLQQAREGLYKSLYEQGVLTVLKIALNADDEKLNQIAIEIFSHFVEAVSTLVREFILSESDTKSNINCNVNTATNTINSNNKLLATSTSTTTTTTTTTTECYEDISDLTLLNLVIKNMINDPDQELSGAMQIVNLLKLLIDPENMLSAINKAEKSEFLAHFYRKNMSVLLVPLFTSTSDYKLCKDDYRTAQLQNLILDFLSFCVEHHTYHIKNYVLHKELLKHILVLLKSKHQFLALSALRFLRKTISLKEEMYNRHIIKANLFEPVVEALKTNGSRYNILNSAIIELFDFIKTDDIRTLITYVVETFYKDLENINYVKTFKELKTRFDQSKERANELNRSRSNSESTPSSFFRSGSNERFRPERIDFDKDEDAWIEEDDDDIDNKIEPNTQNLHNSLNDDNETSMDYFLDFKKTSTNACIDNEDTIFTPSKNLVNMSSSTKSHGTISINIRSSSTAINSTINNVNTSTVSSSSTTTITTITSNNGSKFISNQRPLENETNGTNKTQQHSEYTNSSNLSTLLTTPNNSPINAKKFSLVDYEDDSDDDDNETYSNKHTNSASNNAIVNNTKLINVKLNNTDINHTNFNNNNNNNNNENNDIENSTTIKSSPLETLLSSPPPTILRINDTMTDAISPTNTNSLEPANKRARLSNS